MRDYIPVRKHWFEMYIKTDRPYWSPHIKFPIEKIKIDKSLFAYPNEVSRSDVFYMLANFDRDAWEPILLNKKYYLLDGQNRLEVARQIGLSFVDAIIEDTKLLEGNSKEADDGKKGALKR